MWKQAAHISLLHGWGGQAGVREESCMGSPSLAGREPGLLDWPRMHIRSPIPLILAGSRHSGFSPGLLRSIWRKRHQQKKSLDAVGWV